MQIKPRIKKTKSIYAVEFSQGNQIGMVQCKELIFPSAQEVFITLQDITFPLSDSELSAIYIPKHLILNIRERPEKKANHLKVVDIRGENARIIE